MKSYKFIIVAGVLFLTACQAKQPLTEEAAVHAEPITAEGITQDHGEFEESAASNETAEGDDEGSMADTDTPMTEAAGIYEVKDVAGMWHVDGQKTEEANEVSLLGEFGSGIHLGNEMVLSENGGFSYHISINQGGEGVWKLAGNEIKADFTTYEPDAQEEQLTMTPETGEDGEIFIKMTCEDGYILFWTRLEGEDKTAAKVPLIPQSAVSFEGYPKQTDYESIKALSIEPIKEEEGVYGGSPVIWSTLNDGRFLHFYHTVTYPEKQAPEYAGYAIIGEDVKLACGLHVGMTAQEAEIMIPGLYHFKWDDPDSSSVLDWNVNTYPEGWCRQFPQILIAEVDNGSEMPLTVGLMLDGQEIIRAIAFNWPTAG